jgi:hypothetical protein
LSGYQALQRLMERNGVCDDVGKRYVPKTYNNRRGLRIIISTIVTLALSLVILFLILFFVFAGYVGEDGILDIPWLTEESAPITPSPPED